MSVSIVSGVSEKDHSIFRFERMEGQIGGQSLKVNTFKESMSFVYVTAGEVIFRVNNEAQTVKPGEYTFFYKDRQVEVQAKSLSVTEFQWVQFSPGILMEQLTTVCCFVERITDSVENKISGFLVDEPIKSSPGIVQVLSEIQTAETKPDFQRFFLNACGYKLIGLYLEQQDRLNADCGHIKQKDVEKMHQVRTLIEENVQKSLSISELAKEVGTNVAYLKKHFKDTFGTTVFGYTLQYRMELSQSLLSNSDLSISDVAYQVGYKHATHFSQAFKKYYGYLPNSVKRAICFILGLDSVSYVSFLAF